jgi:hypothetical protein
MRAEFLPIPGTEEYAVFFPDSIRYYRVDERDKRILEDIMDGASFETLRDQYGISETAYHRAVRFLRECPGAWIWRTQAGSAV